MEGMEIVLIEDDEDAAVSMLKFLKANFTNDIRYIQDGQRAAEYLLFNYDNTPKLILLDIVLPYLSGTELFEMIRLEPKSKRLFVLFLVNDESAVQYIEGLGLKPDGYLKKARGSIPPARMYGSGLPSCLTARQISEDLKRPLLNQDV
jgi:DNA-binding response OmpR family regulator